MSLRGGANLWGYSTLWHGSLAQVMFRKLMAISYNPFLTFTLRCWCCSIVTPQHSRRLQPLPSAIGLGSLFTTTWTNTCLGMMVRFVCTKTIYAIDLFKTGLVFSFLSRLTHWTGTAMQQLCRNATIGQIASHNHFADNDQPLIHACAWDGLTISIFLFGGSAKPYTQVFVLLSLATPPVTA